MEQVKEIENKEKESEKEERALRLVLDCKKESLDFYSEKFKSFNYFDRLYIKGASKVNTPIGRANLELSHAFQQVEPYICQLVETMLGEAPYIKYGARRQENDQIAEEITDFAQYQLEEGNFIIPATSFFRNLGKYGSAVLKINWETDILIIEKEVTNDVERKDPVTGNIIIEQLTEMIEEEIIKHDGPSFYNISLFDFFVPRSATNCDVQKMEYAIHRSYRDIEDILRNPNYTRNIDKLKDAVNYDEDDKIECEPKSDPQDQYKSVQAKQNNGKGLKKFEGKIEVLEYWGTFKIDKKGNQVESLIVVADTGDEQFVIRLDKNPLKYQFKPFIMANDYVNEGEPYGYGELNHIKGLMEESTALRNARLDVANFSLNNMWLIERQAGINIRDLYSAPNKVIQTNNLNGIKRLDMAGATPSSYEELARIDFDIQNTTEIINPRQDVSSVGAAFGGTATGVNFLSARTNLRLLLKARLLDEMVFEQLAKILDWYNKDLLEDKDEITYKVSGSQENPYRSISGSDIMTEVAFQRMANPRKITTAEKRENVSYLLQVIAQIEKVKPGTNNLVELLKEVYKMSGYPHPDKYVLPQQTTVMQLPDGNVVDDKGTPVQIVPVDEQGNPIQQEPVAQ